MSKVSILLSVYNGERFMRQAVESLLKQTYRDFELLVVDDASTDSTPNILEEFAAQDHRIRVLTNSTNLGLTRSLNVALRQTHGELVARMDADDIALPERLEKQIAFLNSHPDVGIVGTAYQFIDGDNNVIGEKHPSTTDDQLRRSLIRSNPFLHSSVMIRRTLLDQVNGYDETYRRAQDYDLWMRLAPLAKLANLTEVLMKKRFTTGMISYAREREQIRSALRVRWIAIAHKQYPLWCFIYLVKPFLTTILPLPIVRSIRIHFFNQTIYRQT